MSMVKDIDQHISVNLSISLSVSLSDSLRRINMKLRVVIPAESYSRGWTNPVVYLMSEYSLVVILNS